MYEQLNQAFNFAIKNKYLLQNPMDDVIKPKSTKEDKEVRALTIEKQQSLSNYLLNCTINEETYKNVFLIQMYLGLRIGETLALNINDIDIEKQIINAIGLEDLKSEVSKIWQLLNLLTQKLH